MKPMHRKLLALAAHSETPTNEAVSAIRRLAALVESGDTSGETVVTMSFNGARDRIADLEAEIEVLRLQLAARDPIVARNRSIRNDFEAGATRAELMARYGLGRTQLWKVLNVHSGERRSA